MAVRTGEKTELLRSKQTPELIGMISELDFDGSHLKCLNDNDTAGGMQNTIMFGLFALADILLIIKIISNAKKYNSEAFL